MVIGVSSRTRGRCRRPGWVRGRAIPLVLGAVGLDLRQRERRVACLRGVRGGEAGAQWYVVREHAFEPLCRVSGRRRLVRSRISGHRSSRRRRVSGPSTRALLSPSSARLATRRHAYAAPDRRLPFLLLKQRASGAASGSARLLVLARAARTPASPRVNPRAPSNFRGAME